jgi:hypothetical protein
MRTSNPGQSRFYIPSPTVSIFFEHAKCRKQMIVLVEVNTSFGSAKQQMSFVKIASNTKEAFE